MSRPIKFRAQDKHGVWHYSDGKEYHPAFIGPAIFWRGIEIGSLRKDTLGEFTGLHDKNGKEIWEGDILKTITGDFLKKSTPSTVYWSVKEASFGLKLKVKDTQELVYLFSDGPSIWSLEVLGNIYSNPELLK